VKHTRTIDYPSPSSRHPFRRLIRSNPGFRQYLNLNRDLAVSMLLVLILFSLGSCARESRDRILFSDGFSGLETGMFSEPVGPHTEYHFLPEAAPKGNWAVSAFTWEDGSQRAWQVVEEDGAKVMLQSFDNLEMNHTHPMIVSGDSFWRDYTVSVRFSPESERAQSGFVFRYRNDRCYYFFGVERGVAVLRRVHHATGFHQPDVRTIGVAPFSWRPGQIMEAVVTVEGSHIDAWIDGKHLLEAEDDFYSAGRIGLMADVPTRYYGVEVRTSESGERLARSEREKWDREEARLQAENPKPVVWKKINTEGFGVGRNLRFGDLDGDGRMDVLIGQVVHHAWPRDSYSELSCLTAMTFDGKRLWQIGDPDPEKWHLTNDVAFQIHDLDNDGRNEVIYTRNFELIIADGATGRVLRKAPTPQSKAQADRYPRILGDCLYFCDLRGTGHDSDIIIKDRYWNIWALNNHLESMWEGACKTGHYPYAFDVDGDGKDELVVGYSLFDDDGTKLWSLDESVEDHADGVAVVNFSQEENAAPRILFAASDAGVFFTDLRGNILKHHWIGHGQNPAVADFRPDLPGLEALSINFWGNQGIIHYYDSSGEIYYDFEPNQYGSMCLPINWTGRPGEFFVHSPNIREGGMFDGWGRRVVVFPDDGHPDMCNAVLDITGDCRDEVVVWDPNAIWVYTQDDNPKAGRLYKPTRNPLYNYSNYQATVSLPGWSEK